MRALLKWLLRLAGAAIVLAILLGGSAAVVMNTERGTHWALDYAARKVPGQLVLGDYRGTLWRGLRFESLEYSRDGLQVLARELDIAVNWPLSTFGQLRLRRLHADGLRIVTAGSDEPMTELTMPPLPVAIAVASVDIGELRIDSGDNTNTINRLRARSARLDGSDVTVAALDLETTGVALQASDARATLAGAVPVAGQLDWRWLEGEWSGRARVSGTLAMLEVDMAVAGPYPGNVTGSMQLLGRSEPLYDITARWDQWRFDRFSLHDGEAAASGTLDDYRLHAASTRLHVDDRDIAIEATGHGDLAGLEQFVAVIRDVDADAELTGRVAWRSELTAAARFTASTVLAEHELQVSGELDYGAAGLRCDGCSVRAGSNRVDFDGQLVAGDVWATFEVAVPRFEEFVPAFPGTIVASGNATAGATGAAAAIEAATVTLPDIGAWRLDRAMAVRWSDGKATVSGHAWSGQFGRLQVASLTASAAETELAATLVEFPLGIANAWLPGNVRAQGFASATADLGRRGDAWSGTLQWRQQDTALVVEEIGRQTTRIEIPEAWADVTLDGRRIDAVAGLAIDPGVSAGLELVLTDPGPDAHIAAELRATGTEFAWVSALAPEIDRVHGSIDAELRAEGPLAAPGFDGNITLRDGRASIPALNVPLEDVNLVLRGGSRGNLDLDASARAGSGTIGIAGRVTDVMRQDRTLEVRIDGDAAEVVNWPEYRIWATPAVTITRQSGAWRFAGDVTLPKAEVALRGLPEGAVTESADVIVIGEEPVAGEQLRWSGDARLVLGDEVHFRALGLDTKLRGELRVRARPGKPTTLAGTVSLAEGTFTAFGQQLTIRDGQLTYTGPLDDPIVDVTAVRTIETIDGTVTAGIQVTGRARDLTTTVFAEPAMGDADALSYLVVGRPLNEATEAEGGDVSGAAVALGLKQATRLTQQIGQSVGLDQLGLTGDGGDSTALVAGKQVNSRLYARYTYGVFSRVGSLLLRYRLNRNLTLEADAGETQSIDILYTLERD